MSRVQCVCTREVIRRHANNNVSCATLNHTILDKRCMILALHVTQTGFKKQVQAKMYAIMATTRNVTTNTDLSEHLNKKPTVRSGTRGMHVNSDENFLECTAADGPSRTVVD